MPPNIKQKRKNNSGNRFTANNITTENEKQEYVPSNKYEQPVTTQEQYQQLLKLLDKNDLPEAKVNTTGMSLFSRI